VSFLVVWQELVGIEIILELTPLDKQGPTVGVGETSLSLSSSKSFFILFFNTPIGLHHWEVEEYKGGGKKPRERRGKSL